jgi:hypothetical protein
MYVPPNKCTFASTAASLARPGFHLYAQERQEQERQEQERQEQERQGPQRHSAGSVSSRCVCPHSAILYQCHNERPVESQTGSTSSGTSAPRYLHTILHSSSYSVRQAAYGPKYQCCLALERGAKYLAAAWRMIWRIGPNQTLSVTP